MRSKFFQNHDGGLVEQVRILELGHGILPQHGVRNAYLEKVDMQIKKGAPVLSRPFSIHRIPALEQASVAWNENYCMISSNAHSETMSSLLKFKLPCHNISNQQAPGLLYANVASQIPSAHFPCRVVRTGADAKPSLAHRFQKQEFNERKVWRMLCAWSLILRRVRDFDGGAAVPITFPNWDIARLFIDSPSNESVL